MIELGAAEKELQRLYKQEEDVWKQRAKLFWLKDGDLNTKAFHLEAKGKQRKNQIKALQNDRGEWLFMGNGLEDHVKDYFGDLFTSS